MDMAFFFLEVNVLLRSYYAIYVIAAISQCLIVFKRYLNYREKKRDAETPCKCDKKMLFSGAFSSPPTSSQIARAQDRTPSSSSPCAQSASFAYS